MSTNGPDAPKFTSVTAGRSPKLLRHVHVRLRGFVVAGCRVAAVSPRHHIPFRAALLVRSDHALRWPRCRNGDAGGTRTDSAVALSICILAVGPMFTNDNDAAARHHTPLLAIGPRRCRFMCRTAPATRSVAGLRRSP